MLLQVLQYKGGAAVSTIRSFLFVPASNSRRVEKALLSPAEAVILDLEDGVAASEKDKARLQTKEILQRPHRPKVYVRINSLGSGLALTDMQTVVGGYLDGIVLPKAESADEILIVDWVLAQLERLQGLPPGKVELIPLVESARGVEMSREIAAARPRVSRLAFGSLDYQLDIGVLSIGSTEHFFMNYPRIKLVLASRAAGLQPPIDTVFPAIHDVKGLETEAQLARDLGFWGKLVIHPDQIEPVHRVFSPTEAEVTWAQKVVKAFEEAEACGLGVAQVDGKLVDRPVVERARLLLSLVK